VHHRITQFDRARAAQRVRMTDYAKAKEFAPHNALRPPTEERMLEVFAKAEIR